MSKGEVCRGRILSAALVLLAVVATASPADAQAVGARAGVSVDPNQFYFGGHIETDPLLDRLIFRPNVEIGIGEDRTIFGLNFEFVYFFPSQSQWVLYVGAGPALNIIDTDQDASAEGGFNVVVGTAHRDGLFVEFKVGALDSPDLKFGIGYGF